jgi:hypothetical protein
MHVRLRVLDEVRRRGLPLTQLPLTLLPLTLLPLTQLPLTQLPLTQLPLTLLPLTLLPLTQLPLASQGRAARTGQPGRGRWENHQDCRPVTYPGVFAACRGRCDGSTTRLAARSRRRSRQQVPVAGNLSSAPSGAFRRCDGDVRRHSALGLEHRGWKAHTKAKGRGPGESGSASRTPTLACTATGRSGRGRPPEHAALPPGPHRRLSGARAARPGGPTAAATTGGARTQRGHHVCSAVPRRPDGLGNPCGAEPPTRQFPDDTPRKLLD